MEMLNFTVGPVMTDPIVLETSGQSSPYFRNQEFSDIILENENLMLEFLKAPQGSRCIFLTTSGTGAMESCVINLISSNDKVLVINGGSFGHRFVELCALHEKNYSEIICEFGRTLKREQLEQYAGQGYTTLLVNMGETSSGVLYDMEMISDFCKRENIALIVDSVSSFIADKIDMAKWNAMAILTGSQKALALHPGVALVALSSLGLKKINEVPEKCMYLSMRQALRNGDRGQTPFTPAIQVLLEMNVRLNQIKEAGGVEVENDKIAQRAKKFREFIKNLPFELVPDLASNAVTTVRPKNIGAKRIIEIMKNDYHIWVCPNGGEIADKVFRVGHIGYITDANMENLMFAFEDMNKRGLL